VDGSVDVADSPFKNVVIDLITARRPARGGSRVGADTRPGSGEHRFPRAGRPDAAARFYFEHARIRLQRDFDELLNRTGNSSAFLTTMAGMKLDYGRFGPGGQGDSHAWRHHQTTRTRPGIRVHPRRRRTGVVLSSQRGCGQLRPTERRSEGELRRRAFGEGAQGRQRAQRRLILFDIDGTLVLTGGAGGRALANAFQELYGIDGFRGVSMAGRTDKWILTELAARHGVVADDSTLQRLRDSYLIHLKRQIHEPAPGKGILPGVSRLLDTLIARDDVYLALLTGNLEAGARIKLEYFNLWRYFGCGAFGDDTVDRTALFGQAMKQVEALEGIAPLVGDAVVVGDTPFDIQVAVAGGARSLAVATGSYDPAALRAAGADVVVSDLSDLAAVLDALGIASE
jgi:phosphoglycolate phosphatase